uniref:Uncharacterized protein n=1 Tax=Solibacter usitatus (strain Ellin6076) TaxID=234267 RepID=Q01UR7_SOLUE
MRVAILIAGTVLTLTAQSDLPPGILLLARVKAHTRMELKRLPNCSCLETVHREITSTGRKLRPLDVVRLEVLYSEGKEMYAPPGDRRFAAEHPSAFAGGGMIGDGYFALYLSDLTGEGRVSYEYKGEEEVQGRRLARYDFRLPAMMSGHTIHMIEGTGTVGSSGSFWADPATYDIVRLEFQATEIPPFLPLAESSHSVEYQRTKLGENEFLLPRTASTRMIRLDGEESLNRMEFSQCHLYGAESSISFGMKEEVPRFATTMASETELKPLQSELEITTRLSRPITLENAVGSLIEATVSGNVPRKGKVLIPDGSAVRGRIKRLEWNEEKGGYYIVGLEFREIDAAGVNYRFFADLRVLDRAPGVGFTLVFDSTQNKQVAGSTEILSLPEVPGVGTFFVRGRKLDLPKGFRMNWKTRSLLP